MIERAMATSFYVKEKNKKREEYCYILEIEEAVVICETAGITSQYPITIVESIAIYHKGKKHWFGNITGEKNAALMQKINEISSKRKSEKAKQIVVEKKTIPEIFLTQLQQDIKQLDFGRSKNNNTNSKSKLIGEKNLSRSIKLTEIELEKQRKIADHRRQLYKESHPETHSETIEEERKHLISNNMRQRVMERNAQRAIEVQQEKSAKRRRREAARQNASYPNSYSYRKLGDTFEFNCTNGRHSVPYVVDIVAGDTYPSLKEYGKLTCAEESSKWNTIKDTVGIWEFAAKQLPSTPEYTSSSASNIDLDTVEFLLNKMYGRVCHAKVKGWFTKTLIIDWTSETNKLTAIRVLAEIGGLKKDLFRNGVRYFQFPNDAGTYNIIDWKTGEKRSISDRAPYYF